MTHLFKPLTLRETTFQNRVWLASMCQYSAFGRDGVPTNWHLVHLGSRATGGFGLVLTEATAVTPEGRISPEDTGLWNDQQIAAWRPITTFIRSQGAVPGIQLSHAGRKGSTYSPFADGQGSVPTSSGGWTTSAPSNQAFEGLSVPTALTTDDIADVVQAFADAARRAETAGFDVVELHAAHGYLLHQFLSPLSNMRIDEYGGSFENRSRIVVEVVDAVRAVWPEEKPLFLRFSASDWVEGGWSVQETAELTKLIGERGVDLVDVSSGGLSADQQISTGPGYQVPFAREVRQISGVSTGAVGMITDAAQAEKILAEDSADAVFLARAALREPAWPQRAAHELGVARNDAPYPPQYTRGAWS